MILNGWDQEATLEKITTHLVRLENSESHRVENNHNRDQKFNKTETRYNQRRDGKPRQPYQKGKMNFKKEGFKNECKKHGGHEWKDCYNNPQNSKSKPYKQREETHQMNPRRNQNTSKKEENHYLDDESEGNIDDEECLEIEEATESERKLGAEIIIQVPTEKGNQLMGALVDTGTSKTLVSDRIIKIINERDKKTKQGKKLTFLTQVGRFETKQEFEIRRVKLPQFSPHRTFDLKGSVFKHTMGYEVIIGRDTLTKLGINLLYDEKAFSWDNQRVPMRMQGFWRKQCHTSIKNYITPISTREEECEQRNDLHEINQPTGTETIQDVIKNETDLNEEEREMLCEVLEKYEDLFDGTPASWVGNKVNIEVEKDARRSSSIE